MERPVISLNETTGDGAGKFLFDIPDFQEPVGAAAPTEENQDFDFTAASWEVPTEAFDTAKAVVSDSAATESQVFDAYPALVKARDGLTCAPDKSLVKLAIELTEEAPEDTGLSEISKKALTEAVEAAKLVLGNADATQEEINAQCEAVMTRITKRVKADKTLLRQLIAAAEALDKDNYRPSSLANLQAVLADAKAVEADGNAAEAMIAEACDKLLAVITALQSKLNYAAKSAQRWLPPSTARQLPHPRPRGDRSGSVCQGG